MQANTHPHLFRPDHRARSDLARLERAHRKRQQVGRHAHWLPEGIGHSVGGRVGDGLLSDAVRGHERDQRRGHGQLNESERGDRGKEQTR